MSRGRLARAARALAPCAALWLAACGTLPTPASTLPRHADVPPPVRIVAAGTVDAPEWIVCRPPHCPPETGARPTPLPAIATGPTAAPPRQVADMAPPAPTASRPARTAADERAAVVALPLPMPRPDAATVAAPSITTTTAAKAPAHARVPRTVHVLFASGRATLSRTARATLDRLAATLADDEALAIAGFTDARGARGRNAMLATARAEAVRAYLLPRLLPRAPSIALAAPGARCFRAPNTTAAGRALNRRVAITIGMPAGHAFACRAPPAPPRR